MKKLLVLLIGICFSLPVFAQEELKSWVSDIKAANGHITYTLNVYLPIDNDTIHFKNRRDYICSQQTEAVLWGEAIYLSAGKTVDYTSMMDKTKLRKYKPISQEDYKTIQSILPYCKN